MVLMVLLKRITLWFSKALLHLEVASWMSAIIFVMLFGTATPIKQTLKNARVYDRLPDIVLKQSAISTDSNTQVPLDDKNINELVKKVFSANKLQGYSENFLDGMYHWLAGKTPKPDFRIDLTGNRETIADGLATNAIDRLKTLPACTRIPSGPIDLFSITCLPPGVDLTKEKQRITNEVLANKDFFPDSVITADQLPKTPDGQDFTVAYKDAPKAFKLAITLPWLLGIFSIVTSLALVWLSSDKRRGLRTVGRIILVNGSFVFVTTLVFGLLIPRFSTSLQAHFTGDAAPLVNDILKIMLQKIISVTLIVSGTVIALGGSMLLAERFIKPKSDDAQPSEQNTVPVENTVNENTQKLESK